jgi:sulfur carrier protein
MEYSVNGELRTDPQPPVGLVRLLEKIGIDPAAGGIAVAINEALVRKTDWGEITVHSGDRVEVVYARQGG